MGKLNIFQITLSNFSGVYYPGSVVDGHVTVEVTAPMKVKEITLKFKGKAKVHWTEDRTKTSGNTSYTITDNYDAKEKYFDEKIILFGDDGCDQSELPTGRHTFPFQFTLPVELPSSFEGDYGKVRYKMKCKIDKPWKSDKKTERLFTVISALDLNEDPAFAEVEAGSDSKHLCCLCCKSGPIEATFRIDRLGWVPGEAIKCFAEISNGSRRSLNKSYVSLNMVTEFYATEKTRISTNEVARIRHPGIPGYGKDSWAGDELVVPPLPPSFLEFCNIIDLQYILTLNVSPSGMGLDLEVPLGLVIGTVPLRQVISQYPPLPPAGFEQWQTPTPGSEMAMHPMPPSSGTPDLPPPAYREVVTGPVDFSKEKEKAKVYGDTNFTPTYTYYDWGHTPAAMPDQNQI